MEASHAPMKAGAGLRGKQYTNTGDCAPSRSMSYSWAMLRRSSPSLASTVLMRFPLWSLKWTLMLRRANEHGHEQGGVTGRRTQYQALDGLCQSDERLKRQEVRRKRRGKRRGKSKEKRRDERGDESKGEREREREKRLASKSCLSLSYSAAAAQPPSLCGGGGSSSVCVDPSTPRQEYV